MTRVLVTGGAGYVGCVLVPMLLERGFAVRVLDRFRHRSPGLMGCIRDVNLEIVRGDAGNGCVLREVLKDVQYVIPLAAVVGAPACDNDPDEATTTNIGAIRNLVQISSLFFESRHRIIYPNTNSGYGTSGPGEVCTEETSLRPISHYGMTKADAEKIVMYRGNSISYRFATAFGASPRMRTDLLVNDFVLRAVRDKGLVLYEPEFRRNYIHVHDMARAFIHCIDRWHSMWGEVYNVGLPDCYTKSDLCQRIKQHVPEFEYTVAGTGQDPDKRDYEVSVDKITKTGFRCGRILNDGIKELVKTYQMFPGQEHTNL